MLRLILLLHRYLGIAFGLLIALWCGSGIVMMYISYPRLSQQERLQGSPVLELTGCCNGSQVAKLLGPAPIQSFHVAMLGAEPVLRLTLQRGAQHVVELRSGARMSLVDQTAAVLACGVFMAASGIEGSPLLRGGIERDQWTVSGAFDRHRPLVLLAAGDPVGNEWYLSSRTGEIVQHTTRAERTWNWFGAVAHWLYPTILRQHHRLWSAIVIWSSIAGVFLVSTGIFIGIRHYRAYADGRRSPYRGVGLWHHYAGLVFGILTLVWLVSGFFSMNPWGMLEGEGDTAERASLAALPIDVQQLQTFLKALAGAPLPHGTVRVESAPLAGELAVLAYDRSGGFRRLDGRTLAPAPLGESFWSSVPELLRPGLPVAEAGWLDRDDAYYFGHHERPTFPVFRIVFADSDRTRYYLEAGSGRLLAKVDRNARWYRWLHYALHRGDFSYLLRQRPLWDALMLPLLIGAAVSSATGAYMAARRLLRRPRVGSETEGIDRA